MEVAIIFPHQLFTDAPMLEKVSEVVLIEETLFFNQFNFHKQKLAFHRATMKWMEQFLSEKGYQVTYISAQEAESDIRECITSLAKKGLTTLHFMDPVDKWIGLRIAETCQDQNIPTQEYPSQLFINTDENLSTYFNKDRKKYQQANFYKAERKRLDILMNDGNPIGGKWSYDAENRKKYPAKKTPPSIQFPALDNFKKEAKAYVENHFTTNLGSLDSYPLYPTNPEEAKAWLQQFFEQRFHEFGVYEDAIIKEASILNHSVISPLINVGLLSPQQIITAAIDFSEIHDVPLNSLEGFVRQILGWREFIRGMYVSQGTPMRNKNYWNHTRKIPASFYDGTTGIPPIDITIKKALTTGYAHHIERLMVLGNFMLLCEFDPDEVYVWFMELFIDSYDWVMVPNVYGMSQFADGGLFATKPYISGSNYLMKMSNYKKGDWQPIWDGLFWNFMDKHRAFFLKNPRLGMLVRMFDKMPEAKRTTHLNNAAQYLRSLDY
ncbi:cryptochrome/photolyase family protein [Patiriisocius sp. Uisw_047]|jgi:deoxyribodipyrimidine photolyase-related protein|uniref:cryptochrome/photolyase family protein n=1 Tax=Patiriisocius sp. Uisw_047 TaxID=3230969 RepID=UPI0039EBE4EC